MLLKYNGFTLIEVLIAVSILFLVIQIVLPLSVLLKQERQVMSDRRLVGSLLQDEIQLFLENNDKVLPLKYQKDRQQKTIEFNFLPYHDLVEACVIWINIKSQEEKICYDIFEK